MSYPDGEGNRIDGAIDVSRMRDVSLANDWFNGSLNQAIGITELPGAVEDEFDICWVIKDWSKVSSLTEKLQFPEFKGGPLTNHLWSLELEVKYKESIRMLLLLKGIEGSSDFIEADCKLFLSLNDQTFDKQFIPTYQKVIGGSFSLSCKWPTLNDLVEDDTIRIHCSVKVKIPFKPEMMKHTLMTSQSLPPLPPSKETLLKDLGSLFHSKEHADLKLVVGDVEILAHKNILSARSPVFAAMFATPMTEVAEGKVVIEDFEPEVVKAMLEYMYTGVTKVKEVSTGELLLIAEKYGLSELVTECELALISDLAISNAPQILKLAHMVVSASALKSSAIRFIKRNLEAVSKTDDYQKLVKSCPELINEILLWKN